MATSLNIIRIGNSNGIIIPARMLKALNLAEKDAVEVFEYGNELRIRKAGVGSVTPFSELDAWNDAMGFEDESIESIEAYASSLRAGRHNKDIPQW